MKRSVVLGIVLACGFALATPALAQPGGGRGQGGFGGGFGGGMMGGMGGSAMLLRNEAVQKELGLEESQLDELTAAQEEMQGKMPEFDFGSLRELSEDERNEKMAEFRDAMTKLTEEVAEKVNEILLPDQVERLNQIEVQLQGIRAVQIKRVAEELELTDSQKEKIEAAFTEQGEKMREMFQGGRGRGQGAPGAGGTDPREAFTKLNEELQEAVEDVLTSSQKEKLEDLKGEPFDVEQLRRRGGPGGGGPGGPGGRGPGGPGAGGPGAAGGAPGRVQRPEGDGGNN